MVSGLAPGSVAVTAMVGKSTRGSAETGSSRKPNMPKAMIDAVISVVITGRRIQSFGKRHRSGPGLAGRAARPASRPTAATARRRTTVSPPVSPSRSPTCPAKVRSTLTGWTLATPSLTTNTKLPVWLRCTRPSAPRRRPRCGSIELGRRPACPATASRSSLFMVPRTVTMPVVGSTVFSTIATLPVSERWSARDGRDRPSRSPRPSPRADRPARAAARRRSHRPAPSG